MSSKRLYIVGVGPGSKDFITPLARKRIRDSSCLIGARRILSLFNNVKKEKIYLEDNYNEVMDYIKENINKKKIAVLVSGDPGLYSFLGKIRKHLKKDYYEVIPGISTLQLAFARIGETWQDAKIISLHGRSFRNLEKEVKDSRKVFLFTDSDFPPDRIAEYLLNNGIENRRAVVFSDLSYPDERIVDTRLKNLAKIRGFGVCVMIIKK